MQAEVQKADRLRGTVRVPGDKSIAHRALIFGALARGTQIVRGLPPSADVASTAACLRTLGCKLEPAADGSLHITAGQWARGQTLDAGNSGTTARLLAGLLAGKDLDGTIIGDASLSQRPMARIADPLRLMGAEVETGEGARLPMRVRGPRLTGITYKPPVASAQVKSAILIAGLFASGQTTVIEETPTRDHTENMFAAMGVPVQRHDGMVTIPGGAELRAVDVTVPGDISSAAFFLAAASVVPDAEIVLPDVGLNPSRTGSLEILERMGARIWRDAETTTAGERIALLRVQTGALRGVEIGGAIIPRLIDELPILAVVATQAGGETIVRDAAELRHKESDRIKCIVDGLTRMGAVIAERPDGFVVRGPCRLRGAAVTSHGDHRIAMALAVAALVAEGITRIADSDAIRISYPSFFDDLRLLAQ